MLTGTGTLEPQDSYTVTALATGEILEDYFEEGDEVSEDQVLMRLDSANLESSLERAQNTYDNAKKSLDDLYDDRTDLTVTSDHTGTIQVMNLEVGDDVMAGSVIASVLDRDTMLIDVPFMQADTFNIAGGDSAVLTVENTLEEITGTVDKISPSYTVNANGVKTVNVTIAVQNPGAITEAIAATAKIGTYSCTQAANFYYNVNEQITAEASGKVKTIVKDEGDFVTEGEAVVILESKTLDDSIDRAERSLKEAANALQDARDAFDNYEITAPIAGTVIDKKYKKGEKIGSGANGSGNTVAIIYDLSALKFDMNIDELDIDSLALDQEVIVTSDAKPGHTYVGKITNISVQGTTANGTTYYPITVTLDDYGNEEDGSKLRPGMNIDAEIVLEKVENVLAVPVDAVGRGNRVKVLKKDGTTASGVSADAADDKNKPNRADGENADAPSGMPEKPDGMEKPDNTQGAMPTPSDGYATAPASAEYEEVTVETGISDDEYIEILSGLSEGDTVIVESSGPISGGGWGNMMMGGPGGNMGGGPSGGMGGGPGGMR